MHGNPPGDSRQHAAEPRVHGRKEIRHPAGGKPAKWPSYGFFVIHREDDSHKTPKSSSLSWFGRPSQRPGSLLYFFVPFGVKLPTFWRVACCPELRSTNKELPGPCNKTRRPFTLSRSPSPRVREKSLHS